MSFWSASVQAQYTVRSGKLTVGNASVMSVYCDLIIQGEVRHRGTLLLHGDLLANSQFKATTGSLRLVGNSQRIQTESTALGRLFVQGGETKQLIGNISLQDELQLLDGVLQIPETARLTLTSGAEIRGGSFRSYVDGFLYHSGTGDKFYPVGKDGTYAPATLLGIGGSNPVVGMAYFPSPALEGAPFHWQQRVLSGTYDGARVELTFDDQNEDYLAYSHELMVLAAEDTDESYRPLGQSALATQGNRFTITSDQPTALPLLTVGFNYSTESQHLYLPNAFSPSAPDAEDRVIKVYGQRISDENFYFAIQDPWGNVVYETTSWEEASTRGWDGRFRTLPKGAATYRYLLKGNFVGGKSFRQTGTIVQY